MNIILKVATGLEAGREILVQSSETITVGRSSRSNFPITQDTFLSGVHFALGCGEGCCRLIDRGSANGTFLNGVRVTEAALSDGDQITAGQTVFSVHFAAQAVGSPDEVRCPPSDAESPASSTTVGAMPALGSWRVGVVPRDWEVLPGYGLRMAKKGTFPTNIVVLVDHLGEGCSFPQYFETQTMLLRQLLPAPQIEKCEPPKINGAQEEAALIIRYRTQEGLLALHYQVYGERNGSVGIITLTTLASEFPATLAPFQAILSGLSFMPQ